MTDKEKLDAVRAEIHRLVDVRGYDREMANDLFAFMDSLPNEPAIDELEKVVEEIVDPTVLNAYGVKEIANRLRRTMMDSVSEEQVKESLISKHDDKTCKENGNSLTQEPVSEIDFEQELYKYFGQVKDFTLGMRIAKRFYEIGRNHQEPVSEDLESFVRGYREKYWYPDDIDKFIGFAKQVANWQKQLLMAKAVDAVVKVEAGNYPYIPQMELYDYDKDIPLAKEGDRYKVVLIKEAEL